MKVVLIGPDVVDGRTGPVWDLVRGVMATMAATDTLIHTGPSGVGRMVDSIASRSKGAERRRRPKVEVQIPEIGRYERAEALRNNALQLLYHHLPDVIVYVGDGVDDEVEPLLALFEVDGEAPHPRLASTSVYTAEQFILARTATSRPSVS